MVLISTLLAQKLWDDASIANADFPTIFAEVVPDGRVTVKQVNEMERRFLDMIKYQVTVSSSLFARYYFELRHLAEENNRKFRLAPLSKEQADRLEAHTRRKKELFRRGDGMGVGPALGRSKSMSDGTVATRSRAIIS